MAAVLSAGPNAVLSHLSAATLWQLLRGLGLPCEVTVPRNLRSRPGLRRHRSLLRRDEITEVRGIPTTGPSRTLLDLAAVIDPVRLEGAIREAEVLRLDDSVSLVQLIERYPRRKGTAALRRILERGLVGRGRTRSELEDRFLELVEELGLPRPRTNALIEAGARVFEVDCVWWERRFAVELDGRAVHDTSHSFETDRERDRALTVHGWRVIRITWRQLFLERTALAADLNRLLGSPPIRPLSTTR